MNYYKILLATAFIVLLSNVKAQSNDLPTAGFDTTQYHPIFIQSKDGQFKLNIGMYTQVRYNMDWIDNAPDSLHFSRGYNLARTRIFLEGDITDKFYYHFRTNINASGNMELFVAYLQWNISKKWKLRAGKQFMALGREDWMYANDIASLEFSANNFQYAIWTSFGIQIQNIASDKFRYWLGVSNGAYGGRKKFPDPKDSDVLITGRFEWNIMGNSWGDWDDLVGRKGRDFGMLLGLGAGQLYRFDTEALKTDAARANQLNVDFSMNVKDFQFFSQATTTLQYFKEGVNDDYYGTPHS